jgi:hypothetical protein
MLEGSRSRYMPTWGESFESVNRVVKAMEILMRAEPKSVIAATSILGPAPILY